MTSIRNCAATFCEANTQNRNDSLTFHRFPKDPERCKQWCYFSNRRDFLDKTPLELNRSFVLCRNHFSEDQFMHPYAKRLVHNAVPTIKNTSDIKEEPQYIESMSTLSSSSPSENIGMCSPISEGTNHCIDFTSPYSASDIINDTENDANGTFVDSTAAQSSFPASESAKRMRTSEYASTPKPYMKHNAVTKGNFIQSCNAEQFEEGGIRQSKELMKSCENLIASDKAMDQLDPPGTKDGKQDNVFVEDVLLPNHTSSFPKKEGGDGNSLAHPRHLQFSNVDQVSPETTNDLSEIICKEERLSRSTMMDQLMSRQKTIESDISEMCRCQHRLVNLQQRNVDDNRRYCRQILKANKLHHQQLMDVTRQHHQQVMGIFQQILDVQRQRLDVETQKLKLKEQKHKKI